MGIACGIGGGTGTGGGGGGGSTTGGGGGSTTGGGGGSTTGGGGGTTGGGGGATGGGGGSTTIPETITAAKGSTYPAEVKLKGVVVSAISFAGRSGAGNCAGETSPGVNASFWVTDPNNSQVGVWVEKFRCDRNVDYFPAVGDVLDIDGMIGFESGFEDRVGFRVMVKSEYDYVGTKPSGYVCELTSTPACRPLVITKTSSMSAPPIVDVPSSFGGGGAVKAEPTYAGARIKIAGPLTLSDPSPIEMKRTSALSNDTQYYGYKLSNGVLVNDFRTFGRSDGGGASLEDGGVSRCDVRGVVLDGGSVTFPNGIAGVWDTYTHAPCADGGTSTSCFRNRGSVPGTPDANYTYVLYPTDCGDLLQ